MYVDRPPWRLVGNSLPYRRINTFVALVYFAAWAAIMLLVEDPWRTDWMLLGIFGPLVLIVVSLPLLVLLDRAE